MHDLLVEDVAGDSWTTLVHAPGAQAVATRRLRARTLATSGLALYKRIASTVTQLATGGPPVGTIGRRYTIRVDVAGNLVEVYVDGALAITHVLSGGDEVTFAGKTLAGLHARSAAAARFFSAQWWSLTA